MFDCLPHSLIIAKLYVYGLELPACKLMFSDLCGRKQRVKISNGRSSWAVLRQGVPQGPIREPLLLCRLYKYVDDNSLDSSSEYLADVLYNLGHDGRNAIA